MFNSTTRHRRFKVLKIKIETSNFNFRKARSIRNKIHFTMFWCYYIIFLLFVHRDGSMKCGLYICAHNAIEKLKAEQAVDIYYPTILGKLRRPQFIPTIVSVGYRPLLWYSLFFVSAVHFCFCSTSRSSLIVKISSRS